MPFISVIVPLKDEKSTIELLVGQIHEALRDVGCTYEIVLIDDGSEDGTSGIVRSLAQNDPKVAAVLFRKNCGQTAALSAGFDYSTGDVIIPLDGDLQNDPADIPRLLKKLGEGYDVVSGWRRKRQDSGLTRILPSIIANKLISLISGVKLHDYGCTLKAYRREVVKDVRLYGEMHRFIPVYAVWQGGRTAELPVNHRPRLHGESKYGIGRTLKVVLDLMVVKFLTNYLHKPIYVFGGLGIASILSGLACGIGAVVFKLLEEPYRKDLVETPLPLLAVLLIVLGANSLMLGLLAEISVRTYFESQEKKTYLVKEMIKAGETVGKDTGEPCRPERP